jgi:DNA replication protein DnaC
MNEKEGFLKMKEIIDANTDVCQKRYDTLMDEKKKKQKEENEIAVKSEMQRKIKLMIEDGISQYHLDLIHGFHSDTPFDENRIVLTKVKEYYADYGTKRINKWLCVSGYSDSGKTTAFSWLAEKLILTKNKRVSYMTYKDFLSKMHQGWKGDAFLESLNCYDVFLLDDIFKDGKEKPEKDHGFIMQLIDWFYRKSNKEMGLGFDISLTEAEERLVSEYKIQIIRRIKERCGKFVYGINKNSIIQMNFENKLNSIPEAS